MKYVTIFTLFILFGCAEEAPEYYIPDEDDTEFWEEVRREAREEVLKELEQSTEYIDSFPPPGCDGEIVFEDPILNKEVRLQAGVSTGPLYYEDIKSIRVLKPLTDNIITSLSGLQCMNHLTDLLLMRTNILNINEVAGMTNLMDFSIICVGNQLDLSGLQHPPGLQEISIGNCSIADIGVLIANPAIGEGDTIRLTDEITNSICINLPSQIEELRNKGVEVITNCSSE